jgi:hypothetical protein
MGGRRENGVPIASPRSDRRWLWAALAAVLLAFSSAIVDTLGRLRSGGYVPGGDNAAIEYITRRVGSHAVLVGVYSRYGWHHPGPALFYLFAGPYRLLGSASAALALTALLINIGCIAGIAVVLYRRTGVAVMIWGLLVISVYLRWLQAGFLRNDWNPDIALLPFALMVLLCWTLLNGDRGVLPVVAGLAWFCLQTHVGYALGVAAVLFVTALAFLIRVIIRRWQDGSWRSPSKLWVKPVLLAVAVTVLLWAPPLYDEWQGHPGNLTQLLHYFRSTRPSWSYGQGWRELATAAGRIPAWLTGTSPAPQFLTPEELPIWTGVIGLVALILASLLAARRRRVDHFQLLALVAAIAVAAVVAVEHVVGVLFEYLVEWTWAAGLVLWIAVGVVFLDGARLPVPSGRATSAIRIAGLAGFVALAGLTGIQTADVMPSNVPAVRSLSVAVRHWLAGRQAGTVRVDFAPAVKPSLVGTSSGGVAMVLALSRAGVDVQVPSALQLTLGPASTDHVSRARWVVVVAFADGLSPPPGPGQRLLATAGAYQVYVGPARPGRGER